MAAKTIRTIGVVFLLVWARIILPIDEPKVSEQTFCFWTDGGAAALGALVGSCLSGSLYVLSADEPEPQSQASVLALELLPPFILSALFYGLNRQRNHEKCCSKSTPPHALAGICSLLFSRRLALVMTQLSGYCILCMMSAHELEDSEFDLLFFFNRIWVSGALVYGVHKVWNMLVRCLPEEKGGEFHEA